MRHISLSFHLFCDNHNIFNSHLEGEILLMIVITKFSLEVEFINKPGICVRQIINLVLKNLFIRLQTTYLILQSRYLIS